MAPLPAVTHIALTVTDLAVSVAHGGIADAHYGSALSFRDPDNIALELFAPPA